MTRSPVLSLFTMMLLIAVLLPLTTITVTPPAAATARFGAAPQVMAALGDSISRGSSADGTGGDNLHNSWSTGTAAAVGSHRTRIAQVYGAAPETHVLAVGGTESSDLLRQASLAVSRSADYVTILSGGNNVCHAVTVAELPSVAAVRADFTAALSTLHSGLPDAKVFVASIPSMMSLYLAGRDSFIARVTWAAVGSCPVMLADPLDESPSAQLRRAAVEERVDALNTAIGAACAEHARCTYDDGAVNEMPVGFPDLSTRDYFHPSVAGQTKIAAVTWAKATEKGVFDTTPTPPAARTTTVDDTSPKIQWTGTWARTAHPSDNGGSVSYLKVLGSGYSLEFWGTQVSIEARTTPSSGISEVRIDGALVGTIDGYSPTTAYRQVVYVSPVLPTGTHTISVTGTRSKAPESTGRNTIVDALIVTH